MRHILSLLTGATMLLGAWHLPADVVAQNPSAPVRVGGNIKPPTKTRDVPPRYPEDAIQTGVQGIVVVEVVVGTDGRVTEARVIRSVPQLDMAAVEAVRQWQFSPTLLNGNPVPVVMTVTVNFTLTGGAAGPAPLDAPATGDVANECKPDAPEAPARAERRETAIRFVEEVHAREKTALIARQGKGYLPLGELPDAPATPPGFEVQLLAEEARYSVSIKDAQDVCGRMAIFSDQTGEIFVAHAPPAASARPAGQPR